MPAFPIMLLLLFLGASSSRKRPAGGPTGGDRGAGSSQPVAAQPAANARPGVARPAATTTSTEEQAAAQAAVDAAIARAIREEQERQKAADQAAAKTLTSTAKPQPQPDPATEQRPPKQAAEDLRAFLIATKRFGSKADRPAEVRAAQRDLSVTDDGIVGPTTRAATKKYGVTLPLREQPKASSSAAKASSSSKATPASAPAALPSSSTSAPAEVTRTPKQAAEDLRAFLAKTKRHGHKNDRPEEVRAAQRDLGVTDDGIVGPETRTAAKRAGVTLPARPKS